MTKSCQVIEPASRVGASSPVADSALGRMSDQAIRPTTPTTTIAERSR